MRTAAHPNTPEPKGPTVSFNRENVIFQQPDGRWARAFYAATIVGDDPEWDVDYDGERFDWLRTGLPSEAAAIAAWDGANPGGCTTLTLRDDPQACARLWALATGTVR